MWSTGFKLKTVSALLIVVAFAGCVGKTGGDDLVKEMHAAYGDQPFKGGQLTPDHEWSFTDSSGKVIAFFHWMPKDSKDKETGGDPEKADVLFATGDGFKGRWCKNSLGDEGGIFQSQIDAGYVHFHKETSATWDTGHGGTEKSQVGYWLRHVAAKDGVEMMPGVVSQKGKVYPLMPSTSGLPNCGV